MIDFAGGIVVHVTAGVGALLTSVVLGPRTENRMAPHSLPMAVTGAGMLWVGWFGAHYPSFVPCTVCTDVCGWNSGFNGGSALAANAAAASAVAVSQVSASAAALVWMALDWKQDGATSQPQKRFPFFLTLKTLSRRRQAHRAGPHHRLHRRAGRHHARRGRCRPRIRRVHRRRLRRHLPLLLHHRQSALQVRRFSRRVWVRVHARKGA